jgi:ABC-type multidrug transport system permease subunit
MIFFLATLTTATIFITDRLDGIWDRTLVAGITTTELLMAHIVTQTVVMLIQCTEIVLMTTLIFDMANAGSNATVIILLLLLGFAGMLYGWLFFIFSTSRKFTKIHFSHSLLGLFISIFCDSHTMANFMTTGSFYPMIILCGIFWPLEGMYDWLKYFAYLFPFTVPSISMRNVLTKGWGLTHPEVLMGYGVVLIWIVTFFTLCLLGLKIKH